MNPIQKFKNLEDEYRKIFCEVEKDYYAKKITAIEAWNKFPAPNVMHDTSAGYYTINPLHPFRSDTNFLRDVYLELIKEAFDGSHPFPLCPSVIYSQKLDFYNKYMKESDEKRSQDQYYKLKQESEDYRKKIKEMEDLEDNRIYQRERERRSKLYQKIYEEELIRKQIRDSLY